MSKILTDNGGKVVLNKIKTATDMAQEYILENVKLEDGGEFSLDEMKHFAETDFLAGFRAAIELLKSKDASNYAYGNDFMSSEDWGQWLELRIG